MGKCRSPWRCFPFTKLIKTFRRSPLCKKTLIVVFVCALYLIYVSGSSRAPVHDGNNRPGRGLYQHHAGESEALLPVAAVAPTRSNVVYITLKAKRLKPANIRGTVRPKLRRKKAKTHDKPGTLAFTHGRSDSAVERDANQTERDTAAHASWSDVAKVDYKYVEIPDKSASKTDSSSVSSIRIYSQKPPPWFTSTDVHAMRFLARAKVLRVSKVTREASPRVLTFEETSVTRGNDSVCAGQRGLVHGPVDTAEVFAFHLDRVLGLNRTLPAVSRKFHFIHENQPCPVVLWDSSPSSSVELTWGQYQRSLKHKCWIRNVSPKSESDCSSIHHHEWSRLALFDFLLQIHRRLDPHCCGFRPRLQDDCGGSECSRLENMKLEHLTHRQEDPQRLLFTHNKGFFDRNEDNLDFRLLQGIRELPAGAVGVLRSGRLRERLLQSLFIDQTFWESQGGRQGIDKLIDVLERRAKVLLTYINAHGITLTAGNT